MSKKSKIRIIGLDTKGDKVRLSLVDASKKSIEYIPSGTHTVFASVNGKAAQITIIGNEEAALLLDEDLQFRLKAAEAGLASRPFIDFDHEGKAAAAFPIRFYWEDGIRLEVEWTGAGADAISARNYSYFSPEVLFNKETGEILGIDIGAIGALVNTPAFQTIKKLAAASSNPNPKTTHIHMDELEKAKQQLAKAESELEAAKAKTSTVEASLNEKTGELKTVSEEVESLKTENGKLTAKLEETRKEKISAKISAKGIKEENQKAILDACLKSDDDGDALLASFEPVQSGHPPLDKKKKLEGKKEEDPQGIDRLTASIGNQLKEKGFIK